MFFSYPQWLGQASDPSMTVPPQPAFRPASRSKSENRKTTPVTAEKLNFPANGSSSDGSSTRHDELEDGFPSWDGSESMSDLKANTYTTEECAHTETTALDNSIPWSSHIPSIDTSNATFKPEPAGQPPSYQETETETYFYRFSDFYPYMYIPPLDYVHVERYSMPFPNAETFCRNWRDGVIDDMHPRDFSNHGGVRDNQRRATWSSPPIIPSKPVDISQSTATKPKQTSEATKKPAKLGTYSFSFSQRETFPIIRPNCDLFNSDTKKNMKTSRSSGTTATPKRPFIYSQPLTLKAALSQYEEHWLILSDCDSSTKWSFRTLPWPQFPSPTSIEDINARSIRRFLLTGDIDLKVSLRKALLRFHPDKIPKLLMYVDDKDKEVVSQGCVTVAKCLNEIKGKPWIGVARNSFGT